MTPEQFAYWLQGFAELSASPPTAEQWKSIRDHLDTVFEKVTPAYVPSPSALTPSPGIDQWLGRNVGKYTSPSFIC